MKPFAVVVSNRGLRYQTQQEHFSPSEKYPEYLFDSLSQVPNSIYAAFRQLLWDAPLDADNRGTANWNPLGHYIARDSSVFVLCNFVYRRRESIPSNYRRTLRPKESA